MCGNCMGSSTKTYLWRIAFAISFVIIVVMYNCSIISTSMKLRAMAMRDQSIEKIDSEIDNRPPPAYLVWNDHCQIPDLTKFSQDILKSNTKNDTPCSDQLPLTEVVFDLNTHDYILHINDLAKRKLLGNDDDVFCCYQSILRPENGIVENDYKLEHCVPFYQDHVLPPDVDSMLISCKSVKMKTEIQSDAHLLVREKPEIRKRLQSFKDSTNAKRPVSVLMLGIDGLSRYNLRRKFPNTNDQLLEDSGWFKLNGYHKIDDDTISNLMAMMSGYSMATASAKCNLDNQDHLEDCNFIWNLFQKNGYTIAYGEDETRKNVFDYIIPGFEKSQVDYYLRPSMLAIEQSLKIQKQNETIFCMGLRHPSEYIYDFSLELATHYRSEPFFGLFLTSAFSHDAFEYPSFMDMRLAKYLKDMKERGILDHSVVILFSDHGSRFYDNPQEFLGERMPIVYIWLPAWLRAKHPDYVRALKINQYRLTNPYEIRMTLEHILELSGRTGQISQSGDCLNCHSLFIPITTKRSCKDIAIEDRWCACDQYESISPYKLYVVKAARVVLMHLNSYLQSMDVVPPCRTLRLRSIFDAQRKVQKQSEKLHNSETYRIRFTVNAAGARFEATVVQSNKGRAYEIIGSVKRLDAYKAAATCINNKEIQKYCVCNIRYLLMQAFQNDFANSYKYM